MCAGCGVLYSCICSSSDDVRLLPADLRACCCSLMPAMMRARSFLQIQPNPIQ